MLLLFEQLLNGFQYGITLFLLAAGLTLIFGVMGVINLAHGSIFMIGAYAGTWTSLTTGSFLIGIVAALICAAIAGALIEFCVIRQLYKRNHLDQVLATFALILIANQGITLIFGRQPLNGFMPEMLNGTIALLPGFHYPLYRFIVILSGIAVVIGLYLLMTYTRIGMLIRAGSTNRNMVRALGINVNMLYTFAFALGALLAGFAGFITSPLGSVQVGMGEQILITTFVVVVVGGLGSIKGAFVAAIIVGLFDTLLRSYLPDFLRLMMEGPDADALSSGLSSMGIYILMAIVLLLRPAGILGSKS
ncbi:branched-chain amino acid ABC transporter permease [Bartonella sp. HY329]|uniref:branched-chain amino acid ABC transporter permease n=1 Tax=unclassified Bartonella TaxID=2645622 RepID=UPI0021C76294|nr:MULTISPECIES: branched-chain amino acid ABC transporter permease [unclassified Bartonella]UXM95081.1 branched-chain amino acid ABC transporter permease [Bartonella sp. HY329]UXN09404.1 branched-chain amino acid ABC transporter permease [Bartonella sp. HY328]